MPAVTLQYDVYAKDCPSRLVLDRISNKWSMLILNRLRDETVRFNQLRRDIDGISQKVLSQTLKYLERDGLIQRTAYPTVPVTVEYALTGLGQCLAANVDPLLRWAEANMEAIKRAQAAYDSRLSEAA